MSSEVLQWLLRGFGSLFYALPPSQSTFATVEEVPNFISEAIPFFFISIVLEFIVSLIKRQKVYRTNDGFSSVSAGINSQIVGFLLSNGVELIAYTWIFNNYKVHELPFDALTTWVVAFLVIDCGYYFFHRYAHEVNIMWSSHVVHHSSEDYNLTTALRQSIYQTYFSWMFYLPLAFFVRPSIFYAHKQFNTLYQFWIHTQIIGTLGPLEWILNTPSHHRVHHGRNRYCIDKNYAGTLIIWDRIFGTFEAERPEEKVVYGLTHPYDSWDPIWTQFHHITHILRQAATIEGFPNKVWSFLKGPGWLPGKPRLGCNEDIPLVRSPWPKHDSNVSGFLHLYVMAHFATVVVIFGACTMNDAIGMPHFMVTALFAYITFSLTAFGALLDRKPHGIALEVIRIALFLGAEWYLHQQNPGNYLVLWYTNPAAPAWVAQTFMGVRVAYALSVLWVLARAATMPFYGNEPYVKEQEPDLSDPKAAVAARTRARSRGASGGTPVRSKKDE